MIINANKPCEIKKYSNYDIPTFTYNTIIVGSGAAGYNAADCLYKRDIRDIAIVTEGKNMGTSRNTGSDKQTYYKLTVSGDAPDSVMDMAKTLFDGGSMHGDIALCEAAMSARAFFNLVDIGCPFPHNAFGEYVGYKTDHDPRTRATSCGPLTSKFMTEKLEKIILDKKIPIFDGFRVVKIFTENNSAIGMATLCEDYITETNPFGAVFFSFTNVIYAVGGPSAIYSSTVYPESQTCAHGVAYEAGATGINLTESQYGIASTKFRWNLSGTYQQVIPRYVSTDENGNDPREFLDEYFDSTSEMLTAIFLKGYQWPFDPKKIMINEKSGSSVVDIAVYNEKSRKRRVFLDFLHNPTAADINGKLDFSLLEEIPLEYLKNSDALLDLPIDRLKKMNTPAIDLYSSHGIDLFSEMLEISVCAQHNNGGLDGNIYRENPSLCHFFNIGEANGAFGVYRPGGSALNSTQVGGIFAAIKISKDYNYPPTEFNIDIQASLLFNNFEKLLKNAPLSLDEILKKRFEYGETMTECGAFIRNKVKIDAAIAAISQKIDNFFTENGAEGKNLKEIYINFDVLLTQYIYLCAIKEYISHGGKSRGSYLICESDENLASNPPETDNFHKDFVCQVKLSDNKAVLFNWEKVREIPKGESWFEKVYNEFMGKA